MTTLQTIIDTLNQRGSEQYGNESVSQLEHALQCATLAQQNDHPPELVTACLLHDIGHLLHDLGEDAATRGLDDRHEYRAIPLLRKIFNEGVTEPIRLHVSAKRYLCAVDKKYWSSLSAASKQSLELQGGSFSEAEAEQFILQPYASDAVKLRIWDDLAKQPEHPTPKLNEFIPILELCLTSN